VTANQAILDGAVLAELVWEAGVSPPPNPTGADDLPAWADRVRSDEGSVT
jgi:hypothetical protein